MTVRPGCVLKPQGSSPGAGAHSQRSEEVVVSPGPEDESKVIRGNPDVQKE